MELSEGPGSSLKRFFSNPLVGFIGTLASILSVGWIVFSYFTDKRQPELTYVCNPIRTQIVQSGGLSNLQVFHDGEQIRSDVTAIQVAVWNNGKIPITPADILEDIELTTTPSVPILDADVVKTSREITHFQIDRANIEKGRLKFRWRILEQNDGGVIQLIVAGGVNTDIAFSGAIIGQQRVHRKRIVMSSSPSEERLKARNGRIFLKFFGLGLCLLGIVGFIQMGFNKATNATPLISIGFIFGGVTLFILADLLNRSLPPFGF